MANSSIFSAADILIPALEKDSPEFTKWAVIACDQFTSDLSYWQTTESIIDGAHSTYDYILPRHISVQNSKTLNSVN